MNKDMNKDMKKGHEKDMKKEHEGKASVKFYSE